MMSQVKQVNFFIAQVSTGRCSPAAFSKKELSNTCSVLVSASSIFRDGSVGLRFGL